MPVVNVKVIKGVFGTDEKHEMIRRLTDTMVEIEGEPLRGLTFVTIEEIEEGDWGIGGRPMRAQDVLDVRAQAKATAAAGD